MRLSLFHVFVFLTLCFGLYNVLGYVVQYINSPSSENYQTTTGLILGSTGARAVASVTSVESVTPKPEVTVESKVLPSPKAYDYGFPKQFKYCYALNGVNVVSENNDLITFNVNNEKISLSINGITPFHGDYLFLKGYASKINFRLWLCTEGG